MGDLLKEVRQAAEAKPRKPKIQQILESLDSADRKDLEAAFKDPTIPTSAIVNVLKSRGIHITGNPVRAWRNGL